jgi:cytoskeletal protein CcmA (bactofilin family)
MFNKQANPGPTGRPDVSILPPEPTLGPTPPRRPAGPPPAPSLLGPDLVFEGKIVGDGELHIEGSVRGEIQVARVTIGERARIEGSVRGGSVEVRGQVTGDIEGKLVKLYESAHVEGDIVHEQLSIEVGAFFQGRCQQAKRTPPAASPSAAAAAATAAIAQRAPAEADAEQPAAAE